MDQPIKPKSAVAFNPYPAALPAYNAGMNVEVARRISGRQDIARLASNENPDGCSPAVLRALASNALEPWRYADPACGALRDKLAERLSVDRDRIVVGNGSEEMIAALSRAVLFPGASAVTVVPSFGLHEIEPLAQGAEVRKVPMTSDLGFDLDALVRDLETGPNAIFISSPWNPVGPALSASDLERLFAATKPGTLFVLDEAYFEFADASCPDGLALLRDSGIDHVVLRTFSKAYGLAGLRVGYAACSNPEIARVITAAKTPFNVNAAAQIAAVAALEDEEWMRNSVARLRTERERLAAGLMALGLRVAPSQTNFLFFECGIDSAAASAALLADGIVVKAWRESGYDRFIRATVGTPEDNDRLLSSLSKVVAR